MNHRQIDANYTASPNLPMMSSSERNKQWAIESTADDEEDTLPDALSSVLQFATNDIDMIDADSGLSQASPL